MKYSHTNASSMTRNYNKSIKKRPQQIMLLATACLYFLSFSVNSFSLNQSTKNSIKNIRRKSSLTSRLNQSTTTSQETASSVSLQWTDFYNTDQANTPVLLLHGLLGSKRNFASLASSLGAQLEKQRRIIAVDLRNHGDSDWSEQMSYTAMAQDVLDFLDSQNIKKVVLVGHSMGGKIAQAMSLMHPNRVEGLVVLDIAPVEYSRTDPHWKAVEDILHAIHAVDIGDGASKTEVDKMLRPTVPDPALRAFVLTNYDARKQGWKIPVGTIVQQLEALAGFDVPQSKYDGDVFIIHGGQSRFVRHAYMDQIADFFPNHMLTTIRGAGHWVHAEAPDDTIALLKRFLDR
jgi:pimeloyl-ACP methyl ester carboxylesterase